MNETSQTPYVPIIFSSVVHFVKIATYYHSQASGIRNPTQPVVLISYRRFRKTYRSSLQSSRIKKKRNPSFLTFGSQARFERFAVDPSELRTARVSGTFIVQSGTRAAD